ncbi:uncharacterized protein LOC127801707 isoform X1 [Diospyros lotus]|uniref:uncharacterized protein LOC127801707 isoform X1 n=1 Tax=Diospyros lotus TaxID=55363 RepID=UPI00225BEE35|nr:uncharacterized protein LOC127801707 isoform X1 [Diospyros lotus]
MTKLIDQKGKGCARLRKNLFIYAIHQVKHEISRSYEKIAERLKFILKEEVIGLFCGGLHAASTLAVITVVIFYLLFLCIPFCFLFCFTYCYFNHDAISIMMLK